MNVLRWTLLLHVLVPAFSDLALAESPLFENLLRSGVPVSSQETVALPAPTLADGLKGPQQRELIEKLIQGKYNWESFTRKSVVSPFMIKITDNTGENARIGRRVDLWFVAYGKLATLQSDDFLNSRFQNSSTSEGENSAQVKLLSDAELASRSLKVPAAASDPRYVAGDMSLFEKVRVSATTRNEKSATSESIIMSSILDQAFNNDGQYPNRWRSILRDAAGQRQLGPWQPYVGLGSYVKATALAEPAGALLIEYHVAFAEPEGWFQGANLLRSKLPIVAQDSVRRFRRSLEEK